MPAVERSAVFDCTAEAVWLMVGDLAWFAAWFVTHEGFAVSPPKVQAGATFGQGTRLLGMPAQLSWTIRSVEPGRSRPMVGQGTIGVQVTAETNVSPSDGETTVTIKLSLRRWFVTGPISATVEKEVTGKLDDSQAKLRAVPSG